MDLYIERQASQSGCPAQTTVLEQRLEEVWGLLYSVLKDDRSRWLEAKAWFISSIAAYPHLTAAAQGSCFLPYVLPSEEGSRRGAERGEGPSKVRLEPGAGRHEHACPEAGEKEGGGSSSKEQEEETDEEQSNSTVRHQMLHIACELIPKELAQVIMECPEMLRSFFEGSDAAILLWFSHFSMDGMSGFKYGARSLAHYALAHRDEVWHLLVWEGKHPQAPVSVAMKTHYFCELNVLATVRALIKFCPGFWSSDHFRSSLADGQFITLDQDQWVQCLQGILEGPDRLSRRLISVMSSFIVRRDSWKSLCHRLLHYMTQDQLLNFMSTLAAGSRQLVAPSNLELSAIKDVAGQGWQDLSGFLFMSGEQQKAVRWWDLTEVLLMHAICCARPQLQSILKDDDDDDLCKKQHTLMQLSLKIHGLDPDSDRDQTAQEHRLLFKDLRSPVSSSSSRKMLALEAWTLRQALMQTAHSGESAAPGSMLILTAQRYEIKLQPLSPGSGSKARCLKASTSKDGEDGRHDSGSFPPAQQQTDHPHPGSKYELLSSSSDDDRGSKKHRKSKQKIRHKHKDKQEHKHKHRSSKKSKKSKRTSSHRSELHSTSSETEVSSESEGEERRRKRRRRGGTRLDPDLDRDEMHFTAERTPLSPGRSDASVEAGKVDDLEMQHPDSFLLQCGDDSMSFSAEDAADFLAMYACKNWLVTMLKY